MLPNWPMKMFSLFVFRCIVIKNAYFPIPLSKLHSTNCLFFFFLIWWEITQNISHFSCSLITFSFAHYYSFTLLYWIVCYWFEGAFCSLRIIATSSFCYVLQIFSSSLSSLLTFYVVFSLMSSGFSVLFRKDFVALKVHTYSPVFPSNLLKFN